MKVKTIKPHYYEGTWRKPGSTYICDAEHGKIVVKRKIASEVKGRAKTKK